MDIDLKSLSQIIENINKNTNSVDGSSIANQDLFVHRLTDFEEEIYKLCRDYVFNEDYLQAIKYLDCIEHIDISTKQSSSEIINRILIDCCVKGDLRGCIFSLKYGADIRYNQDQPFKTVCRLGHASIVTIFIEAGLKPVLVPSSLQISIINQRTEIIDILIENGLDIDVNNGEALRTCCRLGMTSMVTCLLEKGATPHLPKGRALETAILNNHQDIVEILLACKPIPFSIINKCLDISKSHDPVIHGKIIQAKEECEY